MKFKLLMLMGFTSVSAFAQTEQPTTIYLSQEENKFYQIFNQFRTELKLPPLQIHAFLENASHAHSTWMKAQDFLTHFGPVGAITPYERMKAQGYENYTYAGENVACGNGDALKTFRQFAFSPGHLQNMMNPHFHQMGIAREGDGNEKCPYYWTNDFASSVDPESDPPAVTDQNLIIHAIASTLGENVSSVRAELEQTSPETPAVPQNESPIPSNTITILQCSIPASIGKDTLTRLSATDSLVTATRNSDNSGYSLIISYFQNSQPASITPVTFNAVSVTTNPDFPIVTLFSAPGYRVGGFSIQINSKTNQALFDSYPSIPGSSGSVECTLKY